ncbi:MAG: hypothetical protein IRZ09_04290 [Variibacter sp.]|nr:hypothetical protein [Variibacter sp.]
MPDWLARIRQEVETVGSAPIAFLIIVVVAGVVMWAVLQLSYGAVLSGKNAQIAFLERRLGEWREKMGGMSPDEAKARMQALETQVKALRIRLQPRVLTPEQRQALADRARLRPGVRYTISVVRQPDCSDCEPFAAQIVGALQESSGWTVGLGTLPGGAERPRYGLGLRVPDPLRPPPEAVQLQSALQSAGLSFDVMTGGMGTAVELWVTERPIQ